MKIKMRIEKEIKQCRAVLNCKNRASEIDKKKVSVSQLC